MGAAITLNSTLKASYATFYTLIYPKSNISYEYILEKQLPKKRILYIVVPTARSCFMQVHVRALAESSLKPNLTKAFHRLVLHPKTVDLCLRRPQIKREIKPG